MAENPERVEIALHSALAELYAYCTPAEGMTDLGEKAMERAWEILSLDNLRMERARELEKAEKHGKKLKTAVLHVLAQGKLGSPESRAMLRSAVKDNDEGN